MTYGVYELKDELAGYAALVDQLIEKEAPLRDVITTVERGNQVYEAAEDVLIDFLEGEVEIESKVQETLEEAGFESVREAIEDRGKIRSSEPDT